ncbi:hypothetical protein FG93_05254 [Bosea sp. LC85]|uniref:hypothetical protein n=1 Tax=Bosea sp. LC85 TaxID=1502851 RepID=UPI0004E2FDDB|nr:hypothetical protein [Bosea sp. LC85]KFC64658.1 hypothetical protein FG93_05254 [Bosea sp. LC85]
MTQMITRSYDTFDQAESVVRELKEAGVEDADISVIGCRNDVDRDGESHAGEGAGVGGLIGGAAGLLAGLGWIAIPGIGPVVATGWLASTAAGAATGAVAGGLVGALTRSGVDEKDAHCYAETVRRGGSVVSVRVAEEHASTVEAIMDGATPIDMVDRRTAYEREGWTQFDPEAPPFVRPSM